jgi:hypothetical protein
MSHSVSARRRRLSVQSLEERAVPANNLTITNDPTSTNVAVSFANGVGTIATTGADARLSLSTLRGAMQGAWARWVFITTAADSPADDALQAGSIEWPAGTGNPDLSGFEIRFQLVFRTAAGPNAVGNIDLAGVTFDDPTARDISLTFDSSATNGAITLHDDGVSSVEFGPAISQVSLKAGTGTVTLEDNGGGSAPRHMDASLSVSGGNVNIQNPAGFEVGSLSVTATSVPLNGRFEALRGIGFNAPVTLTADTELIANQGPIAMNSVDGNFNLNLWASGPFNVELSSGPGEIRIGGVGATTPLNSLWIERATRTAALGLVANAATIKVGTGASDSRTTLRMGGTITGNVLVLSDGVVSGLAGGDAFVIGNLDFDGGTFDPSLSFGHGVLTVTGNVTLTGAKLGGGGDGWGAIDSPYSVLDYTGTLTGQFDNAPVGASLIVGTDAVTVSQYGPPGTGVVLAPLPAATNPKRATGVDEDGTGYTITLTGGGTLVPGVDLLGRRFLVVRDSKPTTAVTITTTANASDAIVAFEAGIAVKGPLARFTGPKVDVGDQFAVIDRELLAKGTTTIVLRDLVDTGGAGMRFPGGENPVVVTARNVSADVQATFEPMSLLLSGDLTGDVAAHRFGTIRGRNLTGNIEPINDVRSVIATGAFAGTLDDDVNEFRAGNVLPGALLRASHIGSVVVAGRFEGDIDLGVLGLDRFVAGEVAGSHIKAKSTIGTVKTIGDFNGVIDAFGIGQFHARGGSATINLTSECNLNALTVAGDFDLEVHARWIGPMTVGGNLRGVGPWTAPRGIGRLTAGAIDGVDATVRYLGPVLVHGNLARDLSGDIRQSTFRTTDGGIASLTATGNVTDSTFDVKNGDVGAVRVGRFIRSNLYVDYTPSGDFDTGGSFDLPAGHRLLSFTTTARPGTDPTSPSHWAFQDSEVVADTIGIVRLSGLKTANAGTAFGVKARSSVGSVRVAAADPGFPTALLNKDLTASASAIGGDFFLIDV